MVRTLVRPSARVCRSDYLPGNRDVGGVCLHPGPFAVPYALLPHMAGRRSSAAKATRCIHPHRAAGDLGRSARQLSAEGWFFQQGVPDPVRSDRGHGSRSLGARLDAGDRRCVQCRSETRDCAALRRLSLYRCCGSGRRTSRSRSRGEPGGGSGMVPARLARRFAGTETTPCRS